jgi:hypothetical protein
VARLVRFEGENGAFMVVEMLAEGRDDVELVAGEAGPLKAVTRLEDSLSSLRGAAAALTATADAISQQSGGLELDEVALTLTLSFGVEGGVIVAKGSAKAEASVMLTWKPPR